jgi:hypothetical protein
MRQQPPVRTPPSLGGLDNTGNRPNAQFLATEHWSLLATRSMTWNEIFSRTGTYLTSPFSRRASLSLVANATSFGQDFRTFALLVLPVVLLVGVGTYFRLVEAAIEDAWLVIGINRLRHAYLELAPELEAYFVASHDDDAPVADIQLPQSGRPDPLAVGIAGHSGHHRRGRHRRADRDRLPGPGRRGRAANHRRCPRHPRSRDFALRHGLSKGPPDEPRLPPAFPELTGGPWSGPPPSRSDGTQVDGRPRPWSPVEVGLVGVASLVRGRGEDFSIEVRDRAGRWDAEDVCRYVNREELLRLWPSL